MRIFCFVGGETDWVVAESEAQARECFLDDVQDLAEEEIAEMTGDEYEMTELSEEEIENLEFRNGESSKDPMIKAKDLIAEMINDGRVLPFHLASTCF